MKKFTNDSSFVLQEESILKILKETRFDSVLEFGCGFGRITKIIMDNFSPETYQCFDISPHQVRNAIEYVNNKNVSFVSSDIESYNDNSKYEMVLGCEVLMHVKPDRLETAIRKLMSFSSKHFISIDYTGKSKQLASHNFSHDYDYIYNKLFYSYKRHDLHNHQSLFIGEI